MAACHDRIRLAPRSGIDVLDVDRKNGVDGLENLRALGTDLFGLTPIVAQTSSGGLHFFMARGGPLGNSAGVLGVDVRGDGGMIVLPPVNNPDAREYCGIMAMPPSELSPAPWPQELRDLETGRRAAKLPERAQAIWPTIRVMAGASRATGAAPGRRRPLPANARPSPARRTEPGMPP